MGAYRKRIRFRNVLNFQFTLNGVRRREKRNTVVRSEWSRAASSEADDSGPNARIV